MAAGTTIVWDGSKWITAPSASGISLPLSIANGGTGATTVAGAQTNLGINTGGGTTPTDGTLPWDWAQQYTDPINYTSRVLAPGYNSGLLLGIGPYPPNYRISNGVTLGGILASGNSNGSLPIRIQPPIAGTGRLKFNVECRIAVRNNNNTSGSCTVILGTTASNGPSKPLYPYLGVGHDNGSISPVTILPNSVVQIFTMRLDIVDNAFQADQPIPGWPNWTLLIDTSAGASLLYPAICPIFTNNGTVPLMVTDVFIVAFAM